MEYWFQRFKELRLKKKMSQGKMARALGIDVSSVSRYERSSKDVDLTENFLLRLGTFFTDEEILYIQTGEKKIYSECKEEGSFGQVNDAAVLFGGLPSDVATMVEIMLDMDIKERREVLRFIVNMKSYKE